MQMPPSTSLTFQHPFSMMVTGASQSGKMEWTRKLLPSPLIQPPREHILWCFGQWQPLLENLQKRIPCIEFVHGIPDYLHSSQFISPDKRNLIILDDLMTKLKCEQRIANLFTKGSHHRNIKSRKIKMLLSKPRIYQCIPVSARKSSLTDINLNGVQITKTV